MVLHFKKVYEGYITIAVAPLPRHYLSTIPITDQVNGAGLPARRDRQAAGQRRVQVRLRHPAAPSSASPQPELQELRRPASPPTSTCLVFKWYGDPDAMIAGFRSGEVDLATDLQDRDIPKVQDLGDQVQRDPAR